MTTTDVIAVSRVEASPIAVADCEHPEAVMLDLEQPSLAVEPGRNALDDLERESTRMKHAIYIEEN